MKHLSGPQRKFCEGIVKGLNQTEAYRAAYPKSSDESARRAASLLMTNIDVTAEIAALRAKGDEKAGSAVLTHAEKREYIARLLRTPIGDIDHTSDLCQERTYTVGKDEDSVKVKMPDKLRAIEIDNKMTGGEGGGGFEEIQIIMRRMIRPGSPIDRANGTTVVPEAEKW